MFKKGDKFRLKSWVGSQDLRDAHLSGTTEIDWILEQEFFICNQDSWDKNRVYFWNPIREEKNTFEENMVEKLDAPPRGHPATKIFKLDFAETPPILKLKNMEVIKILQQQEKSKIKTNFGKFSQKWDFPVIS